MIFIALSLSSCSNGRNACDDVTASESAHINIMGINQVVTFVRLSDTSDASLTAIDQTQIADPGLFKLQVDLNVEREIISEPQQSSLLDWFIPIAQDTYTEITNMDITSSGGFSEELSAGSSLSDIFRHRK